MENDLELEDRILTMLSTQYEGIYQIDIDNDSVLCIYNRGNKFKKDGNVELLPPLCKWNKSSIVTLCMI